MLYFACIFVTLRSWEQEICNELNRVVPLKKQRIYRMKRIFFLWTKIYENLIKRFRNGNYVMFIKNNEFISSTSSAGMCLVASLEIIFKVVFIYSQQLPSHVGEGLGVGSVSSLLTGYYRPLPQPLPLEGMGAAALCFCYL